MLILLLLVGLTATAAEPLRVLFIGNSLTYVNDVPAMVESIGKSNGERIVTKMVAYPDFSLEDHWQKGDAVKAIKNGKWSFVVLQQGPSSQPASRVLLIDYAKRFADEASKVGAKAALYMVWPFATRARDFDGVKLSYETAAKEVGGVFLPAGQAWRYAWRSNPKLEFYSPDGLHPTVLGSKLAALVIYQGLTGHPPAKFDGSDVLKTAAAESLK